MRTRRLVGALLLVSFSVAACDSGPSDTADQGSERALAFHFRAPTAGKADGAATGFLVPTELAQVEAARSLSRRVAYYNSTNPPLLQYSIASKVTSTTTAFEVASQALQIFGGNGLTKEFPIEKLMRDARASMIEDGCNDLLSLVGAAKL